MTITEDDARRIALTASCTDSDGLPRRLRAGELAERNGVAVQVMHNGVVVEKDGYCGPWMTELIRRLGGCHEPQEEKVFAALVQRVAATEPEPAMIELGSYWAYYSLWFLDAMPGGRAIGLEPDPAFRTLGERNAALNGREAAVRFVDGAIGPGPSAVGPGETVDIVAESDGATRSVPRRTPEGLADEAGIGRIALLLADIQGAELDLVEQLEGLVAQGRLRFVIVSTHHHRLGAGPRAHQRVLGRLVALGGHVIAEHTVAESYSGDGLVAVSFDPQDRDLTVEVTRCRAGDSLFGDPLAELAETLDRHAWLEDAAKANWESAAAAQGQLATVQAELAAVQADLAAAREEVAALRGSKLWRWSQGPRELYGRLSAKDRS